MAVAGPPATTVWFCLLYKKIECLQVPIDKSTGIIDNITKMGVDSVSRTAFFQTFTPHF